jgi:hypothetical protein
MQRAALAVSAHCGHREGPRAIRATVYFRPEDGGAQSVLVTPEHAGTGTGLCVAMLLGTARTTPFDGKSSAPATTTIGID